MDFETIAKKYIEIFIMAIQITGDMTGNKVYKNISNIVKNHSSVIEKYINEEVPIPMFISGLLSVLILEIHKEDSSIFGSEGSEKFNYFLEDLYQRYLKKPGNTFLKQNGIPAVDSLSKIGYITVFKV